MRYIIVEGIKLQLYDDSQPIENKVNCTSCSLHKYFREKHKCNCSSETVRHIYPHGLNCITKKASEHFESRFKYTTPKGNKLSW